MPESDDVPGWYAIRVRPHFEKIVARTLCDRGYEHFLPLYVRQRQQPAMQTIERLLVPEYVFCRSEPELHLPILMIPGVLMLAGVGDRPVAMDAHKVQTMRSVVASGLSCEPWPYFHVGQTFRLEHGPVPGLEGYVIETKDKFRLVITLDRIQRAVAVEVDPSWGAPVQRHARSVRMFGATASGR